SKWRRSFRFGTWGGAGSRSALVPRGPSGAALLLGLLFCLLPAGPVAGRVVVLLAAVAPPVVGALGILAAMNGHWAPPVAWGSGTRPPSLQTDRRAVACTNRKMSPPSGRREESSLNWARAFFGILIVTVGTLLLLDQAGMLDAGNAIATWWP